MFRSELVEGAEAVDRNQRERAAKALRDRNKHSYAGLKRSLEKELLAERLVAWGRYGSPIASPISIPASAWNNISIVDVGKSVARESSAARSKIFDLRIYPIATAPDALDRLIGRMFVEALHMSVIRDPQISALRQRVINVGGQPIEFGFVWKPYGAVWPAKFGQGGGAEAATGFLRKFDDLTLYNAEQAAERVVGRRFAAMMSFLSTGQIVAEGIPWGGGAAVAIPRSLWQRRDAYIDLENGDIIEMNRNADDHMTAPSEPVFTDLMLSRPPPLAPPIPMHAPAQKSIDEAKIVTESRNNHSSSKTETECRAWLCARMMASPTVKLQTKSEILKQARLRWDDIKTRSFYRAWERAVEDSGAEAWSHAGRPQKYSR